MDENSTIYPIAMDRPIRVSTLYDCIHKHDIHKLMYNPLRRHNMIGCLLVEMLMNVYHFNVTYVDERSFDVLIHKQPAVDLYAVPFAMTPEMLAFSYPMGAVVHFRYGFLLRRTHDVKLFNPYYTRPFTARLWKFLTAAAVVVCCLFYLGAWWEKRLLGDHVECSLGLEVLLIIGGYCQHIFPVDVVFSSRRTAYFTFFLYSYIIYTVYTSNLLSHLVSEKENVIRIEDLESGSFDFAIFGNMRHILEYDYTLNKNTPFSKKLSQAKALPIKQALNALRFNRTALLSDYMSLFPAVRADFTDTEICELIEIDLNDDVRKYIFTSKEFKYKEELKLSTLKAIETGVLKRYTSYDDYHPLKCETVLHQEVRIEHVCLPLIALVAVFGISFIIMILEILFYEYTKVWPFVN